MKSKIKICSQNGEILKQGEISYRNILHFEIQRNNKAHIEKNKKIYNRKNKGGINYEY